MADRPTHALNDTFRFERGELIIGGIPVTRLAAQVGSTPFYAYDRDALNRRAAQWRAAMPERLHLHYAVKANPMPALVAHMRGLTDGFDVASLGELQIALDAGMSPAKISFAGPGKTDLELRAAVAADITVNLESAGELERIARIGEALGIAPQVAVRVNPDFELKSSGMKMSGGPKPFGVDAEQVPAMLDPDRPTTGPLPRLPHLHWLAEPAPRGDRRGPLPDLRTRRTVGGTDAGSHHLSQHRGRTRHPLFPG